MHKILIIISLFIFQITPSFALSIVSDLDDTLKITNVQNMVEAARNALFSKKAFKGMPELLEEMESYSNELFIVTASPGFLNRPVKKFLEYNDITIKEIFMRSLTGDSDSLRYKMESLRKIINKTGNEKLILIGDNTQLDPEVYTRIRKQYPHKVSKVYIRMVKDFKGTEGISNFYTAYDIALEEFLAGRMTEAQARDIGAQVLQANGLAQFIPHFAYCPTKDSDFSVMTENVLNELTVKVRKKIRSYCLK